MVLLIPGGVRERAALRRTRGRPLGGRRHTLHHAHRPAALGGAEDDGRELQAHVDGISRTNTDGEEGGSVGRCDGFAAAHVLVGSRRSVEFGAGVGASVDGSQRYSPFLERKMMYMTAVYSLRVYKNNDAFGLLEDMYLIRMSIGSI
mmetsp:Transcript_21414/g.44737  ORF Transcript_21414/g.44737 Transcript_21414/m.44737 type:complete len:147 (+) Transcript_21414:1850-2290(+)